MIDRIPGGRRTFLALLISLALFVAVGAVLAVTMARGDDPALGRPASADIQRRQVPPAQQQGAPRGETWQDPRGVDPDGGNWQGGRGVDPDGDDWQGGSDAQGQGAPQGEGDWQQGPPLRSGTS